MIPIPPWGYAVAAAVALGGAFGAGWQVRAWKCDSAIAKIERKLEAEAAKQRKRADTAAGKVEQSRAAVDRTSYSTRTIIEREYRNVEVPADCAKPVPVVDGLRASIDAANRAASGTATPAL